jgi:hypothetical protein
MLAAALTALAFVLSSCAAGPSYRFVSSSERDLVLKMPDSWNALKTDDVLKASGVDPSTRTGWMVFYDAAGKPSVSHLRGSSAQAPVLVAQSFDISSEQRATLTDDQLRNALLPVTKEARAAAATSLGAAGQAGFKLVSDTVLNSTTEHGVHVVFSYTVNGVPEVFDQVAVTDPKKTRGHLLVVHCTQTCFTRRAGEIDGVVSSLTVKKR